MNQGSRDLSADTGLGQFVRAAAAGREGRSGIHPLISAPEAFAARVLMARAAERSLDVQYYIWRTDTTGFLLVDELWKAAERGVRVRLLLDDNGIPGLDPTLAALDSHPNIQVRLFNPFPIRRYKALGYLADFRRLNHRMHNKSFTADSVATIVGGRNVGDEYFGAGRRMMFADLDVLAVGDIARDVAAAFDQYWNDVAVREVESVVGRASAVTVVTLRERCAAVQSSAEAVAYTRAVGATSLAQALLVHDLPLEWTHVRLLCDPPAKVREEAPDAALVFANLREALGAPTDQIDIISPYFVPGRKGTEALGRFAEHGVALRILTNSLSATDVAAVHAGYAKRRRPLLRHGARIYELRADALALGRTETGVAGGEGGGSSSASLHAKTIAIDRCRVFVGSLNLDPRSINLNTEMGLVVQSTTLAIGVAEALDRAAAGTAYEVELANNGRRLAWLERTPQGDMRYHTEPKTGFARRLGVGLMAWLPIEWLL